MTFPELPDFQSDNIEEDLEKLITWQTGFGPRYPGSVAHANFRKALTEVFKKFTSETVVQDFTVSLRGSPAACSNICAVFKGNPGPGSGPLLIGTHFDTRLIADNEEDEAKKCLPISGANDGGSGTAILLHMAPMLSLLSAAGRLSRDVHLVLFDAEDVGNIDGNEFASGAANWVKNPPLPLPSEMIGLDMVGGKGMVLDVDAHAAHYPDSLPLMSILFSIGSARGYTSFSMEKPNPYKYIISDHAPFMAAGIPACILIDIDYPQWHTHADLPDHVSGTSLAQVEDVLLCYILGEFSQ